MELLQEKIKELLMSSDPVSSRQSEAQSVGLNPRNVDSVGILDFVLLSQKEDGMTSHRKLETETAALSSSVNKHKPG